MHLLERIEHVNWNEALRCDDFPHFGHMKIPPAMTKEVPMPKFELTQDHTLSSNQLRTHKHVPLQSSS
jgi:hypothetical protein